MAYLHFADQNTGAYLGGFSGPSGGGTYWNGTAWISPPESVVVVPSAPAAPGQTWNGSAWVDTTASLAFKAQQTYAANIASGITITDGGANGAPTATFALDQATQTDLIGVASVVAFTGVFPSGGTTFVYPDITGTPQTFGSVGAFKSFIGAYVLLLFQMRTTLATIQGGGSAAFPSQSVALT